MLLLWTEPGVPGDLLLVLPPKRTPSTTASLWPASLCLAYRHLFQPRFSMVGVNLWCILLSWPGVVQFCSCWQDALSPLCLMGNPGAWKSKTDFTAKSVLCCKKVVSLSKRSSDISEWTSPVRSLNKFNEEWLVVLQSQLIIISWAWHFC